uniref:NFATC2-interacting protein-like n=1 Tax=Myxine glutinosa TaxID=7769 RepID=UPI00358EA46A
MNVVQNCEDDVIPKPNPNYRRRQPLSADEVPDTGVYYGQVNPTMHLLGIGNTSMDDILKKDSSLAKKHSKEEKSGYSLRKRKKEEVNVINLVSDDELLSSDEEHSQLSDFDSSFVHSFLGTDMHQKMDNLQKLCLDKSTDDVVEVPNPPDFEQREVSVKVCYRSTMHRISMNETDILQHAVQQELCLNDGTLLIFFNNRQLDNNDTPLSLGLKYTDIIECFVKKEKETITLKVQHQRNKLAITLKKDDPLHVLMERYRETVPSSWHLQFLFDGVELDGNSTADELDLEDDDIIDIRVF